MYNRKANEMEVLSGSDVRSLQSASSVSSDSVEWLANGVRICGEGWCSGSYWWCRRIAQRRSLHPDVFSGVVCGK
jgi:hypothetical protein